MITSGKVARSERARLRRARSERLEAALIVALAALVLVKGGPALGGIASGIVDMMIAVAPF